MTARLAPHLLVLGDLREHPLDPGLHRVTDPAAVALEHRVYLLLVDAVDAARLHRVLLQESEAL